MEADTPSASVVFSVAVTRNGGDDFLPGANVAANLAPGVPGCSGGWTYVKNLGSHWATVGETYVLTTGATQAFTYGEGQSSSIGAGVSSSGAAGSFIDAGTFSWSSSHPEKWPTYGPNRSVWYQTQFNFGEYSCLIPHSARTEYMVHVNGFAGGARIQVPTSIPSSPAKFCQTRKAGTTVKTGTSRAVTWMGSLGIRIGLGFQASVQTGFDSAAQITYHFTATRHLCGWRSLPTGTPQQLVVRT